jgi:hypothetical protein
MYYEQSNRRTHEIKLRFSDCEEMKINRFISDQGGQPAVLLRELIMEALKTSNTNANQVAKNLEVAK